MSSRLQSTTVEATELVNTFYDCARDGMEHFKCGELKKAIESFNEATSQSTMQPLPQRGIALYCNDQYKEAAEQFQRDVELCEKQRLQKAAELRLWHSACLNKVGDTKIAIDALDLNNDANLPQHTQGALTNRTLLFFGDQLPVTSVKTMIDNVDEKDSMGVFFHGNFLLGLYYDSVGDAAMARGFLQFPSRSSRYAPNDMWYHIPRVLYSRRFGF
jgi:tetratricopeptide (TPR) repeat protein